jgi:predicted peroxiredoxin
MAGDGGGVVKFLYMSTASTRDATLASIPFHLAVNGSIAAGQEAAVVLAGDAAELIIGDNAESVEGLGLPPMRELLAKAREHAIPVYV